MTNYVKKLKTALRRSNFGRTRFYRNILYLRHKGERDSFIDRFHGSGTPPQERRKIYSAMKEAWVKYCWDFKEFFLFRYESLSDEERKEFITSSEVDGFCRKVNDPSQINILSNKIETYRTFKSHFKRDAVIIENAGPLRNNKSLLDFIQTHTSFIIKPAHLSCGKGIELIDAASPAEALDLAEKCIEPNADYIIEELIQQAEEMKKINPHSVNTVRVPTFNANNAVHILHPIIRFGRNGSIIDNLTAGGICGAIDIDSGQIIAASDLNGINYTEHPDSGEKIIGFTIPRWEEAIKLAKDLSATLPRMGYCAWDLALTKDGWAIVEGNSMGQLVQQCVFRKGLRSELQKLFPDI